MKIDNPYEITQNLYDIDMERSILSTILYESHEIDSLLSNNIQASDFYSRANANIFAAMQECLKKNEAVEATFIKKRLGNNFNEQAWKEVLETNPIVELDKYVKELKEKAIKRELLKIASLLPKQIKSEDDGRDIVDKISSQLYSLVENTKSGKMRSAKDIIAETISEIIKQKGKDNKNIVGLSTGFSVLDEKTKGFKEGDLVILAARPGMGKTALALNIVLNNLWKEDEGIVFFSLEMPAHQLMLRMLSIKTEIALSNIMTGKMDDDEFSRFSQACDYMASRNLSVYDSGYINIVQIRTQLRKIMSEYKKDKKKLSLCVIDYIGLMTSSGNFKERHLQIAEISRDLKLLARELELPILALSQLNRGVEARSNKRPLLSDLRESGAIEQDADTILFVYRGEVYKEQEEKEKAEQARRENKDYESTFQAHPNQEKAEIIIGKNRNGALGTVEVIFKARYTKFIDAEPQFNSFALPQQAEEIEYISQEDFEAPF